MKFLVVVSLNIQIFQDKKNLKFFKNYALKLLKSQFRKILQLKPVEVMWKSMAEVHLTIWRCFLPSWFLAFLRCFALKNSINSSYSRFFSLYLDIFEVFEFFPMIAFNQVFYVRIFSQIRKHSSCKFILGKKTSQTRPLINNILTIHIKSPSYWVQK